MREANTTTVNKFKAIEIKLGISSLEISSVQFVQIIFYGIPFTPVHSKRQIKLMSNFKILIQNAFYIETSVCLSVFMFVCFYVCPLLCLALGAHIPISSIVMVAYP